MGGSGFDQKDFLTCCKFAEGDSRVLMQKMSRDRVKLFEKSKPSESEIKGNAELECVPFTRERLGYQTCRRLVAIPP